MVDMVTGDTGTKYKITATDDQTGAVINLTGATVRLRWEDETGTVQTRVMTILVATAGTAEYQFLAGEIISGTMRFETEITDSSGYVISSLDLTSLVVREEMG